MTIHHRSTSASINILRDAQIGQHVRVRVFAGPDATHRALAGVLTLRPDEADTLEARLADPPGGPREVTLTRPGPELLDAAPPVMGSDLLREAAALMRQDVDTRWHPVAAWLEKTADEPWCCDGCKYDPENGNHAVAALDVARTYLGRDS